MSSALILAAGKATRLKGIRDRYAKANVPVGDTTPLRFMLERLHIAGVTEAWINLHYLGDQVRREACRWAAPGMRLNFVEEDSLLGTGGTLLEVWRRAGNLPDIVVNAKMFTDFDFASLLEPKLATSDTEDSPPPLLVLHPPTSLADFGGLAFDADFKIQALHPRQELAPPATGGAAVFTGISRPDHAWLPFLEQAQAEHSDEAICSIRHGLLPSIAAGTSTAQALLFHGYWREISTPQRVAEIREELPDLLG
ncbi:MAG: NTP transferase domain-containing protein [Planctomycetota bacterium]|jgi:NDP-sugar pyrophosphorylase family protein|nr:NTP transferase domain-containing protein [Planctomycetota bacterium]